MKLIAHRGNLAGPDPKWENHPIQVDAALDEGFDVEVDLWLVDNLWMSGHDEPQHIVGVSWLRQRCDYLWLHCKHLEALEALIVDGCPFNWFWHEGDRFTLTSQHHVWTSPGEAVGPWSVLVDLDLSQYSGLTESPFGICTDYPLKLKGLS